MDTQLDSDNSAFTMSRTKIGWFGLQFDTFMLLYGTIITFVTVSSPVPHSSSLYNLWPRSMRATYEMLPPPLSFLKSRTSTLRCLSRDGKCDWELLQGTIEMLWIDDRSCRKMTWKHHQPLTMVSRMSLTTRTSSPKAVISPWIIRREGVAFT